MLLLLLLLLLLFHICLNFHPHIFGLRNLNLGPPRGQLVQKRYTHPRVSAISTSFVRRPEIAYETSYQRSFSTFSEHDSAALRAAQDPADLKPKIAAVSQGQYHPMRDLKYGEFTSQCDLPHRQLESQLHPIGY
jgi:hypothetical protein